MMCLSGHLAPKVVAVNIYAANWGRRGRMAALHDPHPLHVDTGNSVYLKVAIVNIIPVEVKS